MTATGPVSARPLSASTSCSTCDVGIDDVSVSCDVELALVDLAKLLSLDLVPELLLVDVIDLKVVL